MTDSALNYFIASGTHAERLAFTPDPATPGAGPDPSYLWVETDTGLFFAWNFGGASWLGLGTAALINTGTSGHAIPFLDGANTWSAAQTLAKPITPALTFATLPAAPVAGQRSFITDCNSATYHATAAAGGANKVGVTYDGANWLVG